jgi:hypothetical protein
MRKYSWSLARRNLIGPGEVPKRYFALWTVDGSCENQGAPFFLNGMFISRKVIGVEKMSCPISEVLSDNGQDTFEARFNCINVGQNSMQPRPIRLRLANDQLYFRIDDGPEQGPYRDCGAQTQEHRHR